MKIHRFALYAALLWAVAALAQAPKVGRIASAPEGLSHDVTAAVEDKGYRVTLADGWTADLWLAKNVKPATNAAAEALYPELSNGEFVGVLRLPKGITDFRGQAIPAGTYTLRYQLLPQDANHMGVSPNPDFLLAIPVANDTKADALYPYEKLVALSANSTGTHPAVIALEKAGNPGTASMNDDNMLVLTVTPADSTTPLKLGIVVKGQAAQ